MSRRLVPLLATLGLALLGCPERPEQAPVRPRPMSPVPPVAAEPPPAPPPVEPTPPPPPAVAADPSLAEMPPEGASTEQLLAGLDDPEALERQAARRHEPAAAEPGAPCRLLGAPQRLWAAPGMSAAVFDGHHLWVATLAFTERRDEEEVVVVRLRPGRAPRPWVRERIPARAARSTPPALLAAPEGVWIAFVDKKGVVQRALLPPVRPSGGLRWEAVGGGADPRFPPALAAAGSERLLAWTEGASASPGVRLLRFGPDGAQRSHHLLSAEAGGGALPRWDRQGERPTLYFVDPRRSISVLWKVELEAGGMPGEPSLLRPLQHLYEPPALALAAGFVGYRALALDARTALVAADLRARSDAPLRRLVPAEGYAKLRIAAAPLGPEAALFVLEEPRSRAPRAPRHFALRLLSRRAGGKPSPALRLHGPDGRLEGPAVAPLGEGRAAVVAGGPGAVTLYRVRCEAAAAPSPAPPADE